MKPPALDMPAVAERLGPVAVLSTYSPSRDGIARYADQFVAELVKHGGYVRRVGVAGGESGGDELVDVAHGARFLRVVRRTPHDQTVLVMWHPAYFTGGRQLPRIAAVICLAAGFRMRRTIVLQHEPDDDLLSGVRGLRRPARLAEEWLRCVMWRAPVEVWFHSDYERNAFRRRYPAACKTAALEIVPHGATFAPETAMSQAEARHRLGVPIGERMFVCVGFLSIHKGIDRVVRAFSAAAPPCGRLWIVGSAMKADSETRRHIDELHVASAHTENVEMRERYLDDADFDMWLTAADFAVLAYRTAASSSVIPRAHLMGTRVIGSGAGGTMEQLRPEIDIIATGEAELERVFSEQGLGS